MALPFGIGRILQFGVEAGAKRNSAGLTRPGMFRQISAVDKAGK